MCIMTESGICCCRMWVEVNLNIYEVYLDENREYRVKLPPRSTSE